MIISDPDRIRIWPKGSDPSRSRFFRIRIRNTVLKLIIDFVHDDQWRKKVFDFVKWLGNYRSHRKAYSLTNISQKSIQFNKYITTFTIFQLERLGNRHPSTFQKGKIQKSLLFPLRRCFLMKHLLSSFKGNGNWKEREGKSGINR